MATGRFVELVLDAETTRQLNDPAFLAQRGREASVFAQAVVAFFGRKAPAIAGLAVRNYLSGQRLKRRTGSLARSIVGVSGLFASDRGGIAPALRVGVFRGPASAYAGVQELGTKYYNPASPFPTIVPKRAKALAMPVGDALTPAGVPRYESPRDFPGELRFVPWRRGISQGGFTNNRESTAIGGLYEARSLRTPDDEPVTELRDANLLFVLLKSVDLKPQFYLRDAFNEALPGLVRDLSDFLFDFALLSRRPTFTALGRTS